MISFIIPAHNEAEYLPYAVRSVLVAMQQITAPGELIVVNDSSTDATGEIAAESGARVLDVELRQIAAVRNAGASIAKGELLIFIDADTRPDPLAIEAAWQCYKHGCIGGGAKVAFDRELPWDARVAVETWNTLARTMRWAAGSFFFVSHRAFDAVGGFDERFFAAEEIFLSVALHKKGPFTVLPHRVITSARKLDSHSLADHFRLIFSTALTLGRTLRSRKNLDIWYGHQRQ